MKTIFFSLCLALGLSARAQTVDVSPLFNGIANLQSTVNANQNHYSQQDVRHIRELIEQAIAAAETQGSSGAYAKCRQAGYSHESCDRQGPDYAPCRQAGYSHESCAGQLPGYAKCRQAGYSHESCNGQSSGYLKCRQSGYSHESCRGQ